MSDLATGLITALDVPAAQPAGFGWADLLPLALMFFIAWTFILKPNSDREKAQEELMSSLAKDDAVVTKSGVHGKVIRVNDTTVLLEVADKVRLTFDKQAIARRAESPAAANG